MVQGVVPVVPCWYFPTVSAIRQVSLEVRLNCEGKKKDVIV
jgi:hypothetical protein